MKFVVLILVCALCFSQGLYNAIAADVVAAVPEIVTGATLSEAAQRYLKKAYRPAALFGEEAAPAKPDYSSPAAWAALPDRQDDADVAPPNTQYAEAQKDAPADVFFIHPTGYSKPDAWNGPIDDPEAVQAVSLVMKYIASAFNAAARVYAPRYRQATLYSFLDNETSSGIQALELAYSDVARAFDYYVKNYNRGRPFILAGHSQGSCHGLRLLQEKISGTPLARRLVGAYLAGMSIPTDIEGIPPSRIATDTGCVIGWTSYTRDGDPRIFTDDMVIWFGGGYRKSRGLLLAQVNPISWESHGGRVPASKNPGSLPFLDATGPLPPLVPGLTGADALGVVLRIDKPAVPGFEGHGPDMPILNADFGDYHDYDYVLFYESVRKNALDRVRAFIANE